MKNEDILQNLLKDTTKDFETYLQTIKYRMRRIVYSDPKETGNHRLDIHLKEMANLEPIKLDEPNDDWLWMWENRKELQNFVDFSRNEKFTQISIKTLAKSYLIKEKYNGTVLEDPQFMFIRVASTLRSPDLMDVKRTYDSMSNFEYIPASPTLFNAGLTISQMSSCFLINIEDNMQSIAWTMYCITAISKTNGATGISLGSLRTHSNIGFNGVSKGTLQVSRIYDMITDYVDQGGQRPGASQFCQFIWHEDIQEHIELTSKIGDDMKHIKRADTSVGTYNLFWRRVEENGPWSLFCPTQVPGLNKLHGEEFEKLYLEAEEKKIARKVVSARYLLDKIAEVLIGSGRPYVINIDSINSKSNMSNIGFISTLNLCQEIALPADRNRIPACNLSSTCLRSKVVNNKFDFTALINSVVDQVHNLNVVIEKNYYALPEIEYANRESMPIGIGAQGFIDAVLAMNLIFDSEEARELNRSIAACTYYNALKTSCEIAKVKGPYPRFENSPFSKGILQFDMWGIKPIEPHVWGQSGSWEELRRDIIIYGVRNSQLTTAQPTASVSTITDNGETWEPYYSNFFTRSTQNGTFTKMNMYLQNDLEALGLWNDKMLTWIQANEGSIQGLTNFVKTNDELLNNKLQFLEKKHRTVFEISQRVILEMAADRGPYIDASQSTNIYMRKATVPKVAECLKYSNSLGLKTLIYYLRTKEARSAVKVIKAPESFFSEESQFCSRDCLQCQ